MSMERELTFGDNEHELYRGMYAGRAAPAIHKRITRTSLLCGTRITYQTLSTTAVGELTCLRCLALVEVDGR